MPLTNKSAVSHPLLSVCVGDVLRCVFTTLEVYNSASAFFSTYAGTERSHLSWVFPGHAHSPAQVHGLQDPKIFQSVFKSLQGHLIPPIFFLSFFTTSCLPQADIATSGKFQW